MFEKRHDDERQLSVDTGRGIKMSETLTFTIPGEPNGQGRPRFTSFAGHVKAYDPEKSRNYKAFVKLLALSAAEEHGWKCTELAVLVEVDAYMSIPTSKSKKFKKEAMAGQVLPTKKPDIDNIFKCVTDAIGGIAYKDDKQIVRSVVNKAYAEEPKIEVRVTILSNNQEVNRA